MAMIRKSLADAKAKPFKFSAEQRSRIAETAELPSEDASALSDEQLARMVVARSVRRVRERTGLSQAKFAERFHFSPGRLRDLEQGRTAPDSALEAYLKVIETEPDLVAKIVNAA